MFGRIELQLMPFPIQIREKLRLKFQRENDSKSLLDFWNNGIHNFEILNVQNPDKAKDKSKKKMKRG